MRAVGLVVVLLLLLCGDVETNPGPVGEVLCLTVCVLYSWFVKRVPTGREPYKFARRGVERGESAFFKCFHI